jgi:hypothetical protein
VIQLIPEKAQRIPDFIYKQHHDEHPHHFYNGNGCNGSAKPVPISLLESIAAGKDTSAFRGFDSAYYVIDSDKVTGYYMRGDEKFTFSGKIGLGLKADLKNALRTECIEPIDSALSADEVLVGSRSDGVSGNYLFEGKDSHYLLVERW